MSSPGPSAPWSVAVIGAGAAGILAAIFAARRGARVVLLESRPAPGAKIRVSGGGRCNVLPSHVDLDDFDTGGSRMAMRNVLFSWPLGEVRRFFTDELAVPLKTETTGKMFPVSDRSRDVIEALLRECAGSGVTLQGGARVVALRPEESGGERAFAVKTASGSVVWARRVVLATGGLSLPKTGSDGGGLALARALGHSVRATYPALVPLLASDPGWGELTGMSLRARLRAVAGGRTLDEREGDFLFTHRGFSGPVVLDMSRHVARPGAAGGTTGAGSVGTTGAEAVGLEAAWLGSAAPDWERMFLARKNREVGFVVARFLPRRLAERLCGLAALPAARTTSQLTRDERARLLGVLRACPLGIAGNEGYATAEVTGGGIPLEEIGTRTLESRLVPGLHLCGEMLDVVGRIGGYNFLWAWVTGRKAGEGAADHQA